ncbi:MAG: ATP-dependent RNA helicase, partial [Lactobacillus sp.]|nr:ATP-dependent RNA helicase [Lactobacillus sp.]
LEEYTPLQLVSAYLKAVSPDDASTVPVKITPERPLPNRGGHGRGGYKGGYKGGHRSNSDHRGYQGHREGGKRPYDRNRRDGKRSSDRSGKRNYSKQHD